MAGPIWSIMEITVEWSAIYDIESGAVFRCPGNCKNCGRRMSGLRILEPRFHGWHWMQAAVKQSESRYF